jgi:hypothetical protein
VQRERHTAFISTKKGFCYLTSKIGRRNYPLMRIRNYTLDAQDKRDMRRLHPDVSFDWEKIARQLTEKREACRRYRSRRRASTPARAAHVSGGFYGAYDPGTGTVYADGDMKYALPLLDAILQRDRARQPLASPVSPNKKIGTDADLSCGHGL